MARAYVTSVIVAGAVLFAVFLPQTRLDQPGLLVALVLLGIITSRFKVYLPLHRGRSTMSVSYAVDFIALILLGPEATTIVAIVSVLCQCTLNTRVRTPPYRTIFSMAAVVISVRAASLAFQLLGGQVGIPVSIFSLVGPLAGVATVCFLVNTGLVAVAIAMSSHQAIWTVWHSNFLWSAPSYFISIGAAALATGYVARAGYWIVPLAVVPVYTTYHIYKIYMGRIEREQQQVKQSADLHLATVEALACAIDAKDQFSHTRIGRLQLYAARLAEAIGSSDVQIQGIKTAALLHDIGKLAVPEHILSKTGSLTDEEFQKIRIHPQVGAEIVRRVPFPYPVADVILSHHERWDGTGYPQGLRRDAIPVGARILAIIDHFDFLTRRPDQKQYGPDEAVELMKGQAGTAFDPDLVTAFAALVPSLLAESEALEDDASRPVSAGAGSTPLVAADTAPEGPESAFRNIADAYREVHVLYEIARAMSSSLSVADTMALISSKLTTIVPWSGCSLFLYDAAGDSLKCAFAVGLDAPELINRTIASEGEAGWLARNRRTLVNSDPRLIFRAAGLDNHTDLKSAMACPLFFNDKFIGLFSVYHVDVERYTEEHRRLLERVADQAGAVLHNSMLFEQTQEDALTDSLTGLPNRRWLGVQLPQELSRAERARSEVAVIVIDVDGFKTINDSHGHHVGDQALREVAKALRAVCRSHDLCARHGGDEFVVVLSNCTRETAELRRRELQRRVGELVLEVWPETIVPIAASVGLAVFPHDGGTYEALVATADQRMYADKTKRKQDRLPQSEQAAIFADVRVTNVM